MQLPSWSRSLPAQWWTFVAAFSPGFGIKFLVPTLLDSLYEATVEMRKATRKTLHRTQQSDIA